MGGDSTAEHTVDIQSAVGSVASEVPEHSTTPPRSLSAEGIAEAFSKPVIRASVLDMLIGAWHEFRGDLPGGEILEQLPALAAAAASTVRSATAEGRPTTDATMADTQDVVEQGD